MATFTNVTPVQLPGTTAPTPLVTSYKTGIRIAPGPRGPVFTPTAQAFAADGSVVNPPQGWDFGSVSASFSDACAAALDAVTPLLTTPCLVLVPVLKRIGGYNGA